MRAWNNAGAALWQSMRASVRKSNHEHENANLHNHSEYCGGRVPGAAGRRCVVNAILLILIGTAILVLLALLLAPARAGGVEAQDRPRGEQAYLREQPGSFQDYDDWRDNYRGGVER